jgi:pimeloyl-ACP methyl ester carboxylesterase
LPVGYFGASTGAAAALLASLQLGDKVRAIVCRGGRPDLVYDVLPHVTAPTLLLVGRNDHPVRALNRRAYDQLTSEKALEIVPGAGHLFEEPGALEHVAQRASGWFSQHLKV